MPTSLVSPNELHIAAETEAGRVLTVRVGNSPRPGLNRRLALTLVNFRMPGIDDVDADDHQIAVWFNPSVLTRSHLELLIRTAAQRA